MKHLLCVLFTISILVSFRAHASDTLQVEEKSSPHSSFIFTDTTTNLSRAIRKGLQNINFNGQYRQLVFYRNMNQLYDGSFQNEASTLDITDGIRQAQLQLDISGKPTKATFFKSDLFLYSPMTGYDYEPEDQNKVGLAVGVNVEGDINTEHGLFKIKMGGIQYDKLSRLTLWQNEEYGEILYERRPWDPPVAAGQNYSSYYDDGTMARDIRWGNQNLQGIVLSGQRLPKNFDFKLMYVKTPNNGGFFNPATSNITPNIASGIRINKRLGSASVAFNNFNSTSYSKSVNGDFVGYNMFTSDFNFHLSKLKIKGEVGIAGYESPTFSRKWSEAAEFFISLPKEWTKIPIDIHTYRIGPYATNVNASFINTSVAEARSGFNGQGGGGTFPFGGVLADIDQMTNNRQSLALRTEFSPIKKLKLPLAIGWSGETDRIGNKLSYDHRVNGLTLFRVFPFVGNVGPDTNSNDVTTYFRGSFEDLSLDQSGEGFDPNKKLKFNVIEINPKYSTRIRGRQFYAFYLASFHSVDQKLAFVPNMFNDKSLLKVSYHELELYYQLTKRLFFTSYMGYERVVAGKGSKANAATGEFKNQTGRALGAGLDVELANQTSLYVRTRWFDFKDTSYENNTYSGFETSVELKLYF